MLDVEKMVDDPKAARRVFLDAEAKKMTIWIYSDPYSVGPRTSNVFKEFSNNISSTGMYQCIDISRCQAHPSLVSAATSPPRFTATSLTSPLPAPSSPSSTYSLYWKPRRGATICLEASLGSLAQWIHRSGSCRFAFFLCLWRGVEASLLVVPT